MTHPVQTAVPPAATDRATVVQARTVARAARSSAFAATLLIAVTPETWKMPLVWLASLLFVGRSR